MVGDRLAKSVAAEFDSRCPLQFALADWTVVAFYSTDGRSNRPWGASLGLWRNWYTRPSQKRPTLQVRVLPDPPFDKRKCLRYRSAMKTYLVAYQRAVGTTLIHHLIDAQSVQDVVKILDDSSPEGGALILAIVEITPR